MIIIQIHSVLIGICLLDLVWYGTFLVKMKQFNVIGLMSGTSLDGLDIVYVNFKYEKYWKYEIINSKTYRYEDKWIILLKNISQEKIHSVKKIDLDYTKVLSKYIIDFIDEFSIKDIDFISSHGHTALHQPSKSLTYQIGNLPILAKYINQKVVCDFRVQDIELGGQGAPLVPVGEEYLFPEYTTLINLGGFANITKNINNNITAYDICPINIVFNSLCNKIELEYDNNGDVAASGKINKALYDELQLLKFYSLPYPKSLSAEWVNEFIEPILSRYHKVAINDLLNTFSNHFADQIVKNIGNKDKLLITGGGAYNNYLISRIRAQSNSKIFIPSSQIIEYKEALIFAFLGVLKDLNVDNCYSSVTGASKDHSSGKVYNP